MNDLPGVPDGLFPSDGPGVGAPEDSSLEELDEIDSAILDQVLAVHTLLDPPPADLNDRVRFSIALDNLDMEVSRLQHNRLVGSGARAAERTRTITFDSTSLTIMLAIVEMADERLRLDGWLAPARQLRVELRVAGTAEDRLDESHFVVADETGRFVFDGVGHGLAQLLVHPLADGMAEPFATVVTPSLML